jgi:hypothetical protein
VASVQVFWTVAPTLLVNEVITASFVRQVVAGFINVLAFNSSGLNRGAPWDTNSGLPAERVDFSNSAGGSLGQATGIAINSRQALVLSLGNQYIVGGVGSTMDSPGTAAFNLVPGAAMMAGHQYFWNGGQAIQVFDGYFVTNGLYSRLYNNGPMTGLVATTNGAVLPANWVVVADAVNCG